MRERERGIEGTNGWHISRKGTKRRQEKKRERERKVGRERERKGERDGEPERNRRNEFISVNATS